MAFVYDFKLISSQDPLYSKLSDVEIRTGNFGKIFFTRPVNGDWLSKCFNLNCKQ